MRIDGLSLEEQLIASTAIANFRKGQQEPPMDKVIFETNVAQTIALKFATGKRVDSRFNEYEVYYTTEDGRALYASPALEQKLLAFEPTVGVPFSICKREVKDGNRKRIEWQVLPVVGAQTTKPAITAPAPVVATPSAAQSSSSQPQNNALTMAPRGTMTHLMGGSLIASIDALVAAQEYAKSKGLDLHFNEEDVRTCASSIFIAMENRVRYGYGTAPAAVERVNGGATWPQ